MLSLSWVPETSFIIFVGGASDKSHVFRKISEFVTLVCDWFATGKIVVSTQKSLNEENYLHLIENDLFMFSLDCHLDHWDDLSVAEVSLRSIGNDFK